MAESSPKKQKNVKNKRFMSKDINTSMKWKQKLGFFANMGCTHKESLLKFKPSLCATLKVGDSNECEGGGFMDGVTTLCTTLPTFFSNANKCVTYNVLSPAKPNTWWHMIHMQQWKLI